MGEWSELCPWIRVGALTIFSTPAIGGAALLSGKGTVVVLSGVTSEVWGSWAMTTKSDLHTNADLGMTSLH